MIENQSSPAVDKWNEERIEVVECENEFYVIYSGSELDWVAKFNKSWPEAKSWAYHMAEVHNARLSEPEPL